MQRLYLVLVSLLISFTSAPALSDSCWNHNGSIMRLVASGNQRWFYYENPKAVLREAGVSSGTLLFNGRKQGNYYIGIARRFSKYCPNAPLQYSVEGPVSPDQSTVTVRGSRPVHRKCAPTGRYADDTLIFTYVRDC